MRFAAIDSLNTLSDAEVDQLEIRTVT